MRRSNAAAMRRWHERQRDPRLNDPDWLRGEYEGGATTWEIAAKVGCGQATVRRAMKRHGIEPRPLGRRPRPVPPPVEEDHGFSTLCKIWQGPTSHGYGYDSRAGTGAHRAAYVREHGELPEDVDVHHACQTKMCVNVAHLEPIEKGEHRRMHVGDLIFRRRSVAWFESAGIPRAEARRLSATLAEWAG
jgi:hypothetical protein